MAHLISHIELPVDLTELVTDEYLDDDLFDVAVDMEIYKRLFVEAQRLWHQTQSDDNYSLKEEYPFSLTFTMTPSADPRENPMFVMNISGLRDVEAITISAKQAYG